MELFTGSSRLSSCRWRLTKNVGWQGEKTVNSTCGDTGVLTLTSNGWLGFREGAEQCIMPMTSMSMKAYVCWCGLVPDSEGPGQERRVLEKDTQV